MRLQPAEMKTSRVSGWLFEVLVLFPADFRKRTSVALRVPCMAQISSEEDHVMMRADPELFRKLLLQLPFNRIHIIIGIGKPQSLGNP